MRIAAHPLALTAWRVALAGFRLAPAARGYRWARRLGLVAFASVGLGAASDLVSDLGGREHAPAEAGAAATVWVFLAHDCPICNAYAPELARLAQDYRSPPVHLNLVFSEEDLTPAALAKHAAAYHLPGSQILDPQAHLARRWGVVTTPEVVVFDRTGRRAYRGRIDDLFPALGRQRAQPSRRDLRAALDEVLAGKAVKTSETEAVGCAIEIPK